MAEQDQTPLLPPRPTSWYDDAKPLPKSSTSPVVCSLATASGSPRLPPRTHVPRSQSAYTYEKSFQPLPTQSSHGTVLGGASPQISTKHNTSGRKFLKENPHLDIEPSDDNCTYMPVGPAMPIQRFVSEHQCPQLVRIKTDYHSPIGVLTLARDQVIVAMDIEKCVVVSGEDSNGVHFKLPEKSEEIKFAPIVEEAKNRNTFSVQDLFKFKRVPLAFSVRDQFTDSKGTFVPKDSILFSAKKQGLSLSFSTSQSTIKVYSENGDFVYIGTNLSCTFSFKPESLAMSLQTLVRRVPLPVKVQPFSSDDDINSLTDLTLSRVDTDQVVVGLVRSGSSSSMPIVDIPSSLGIALEIISPKQPTELVNIYTTAKDTYASLMPVCKRHPTSLEPTECLPLQTDDYECPDVLPESVDDDPDSDYEEIGTPMRGTVRQEKQECSSLPESPIVRTVEPSPSTPPPSYALIRQVNCEAKSLEQFTHNDILDLLKAMNLSCYCESFAQEQIDGEIFLCLDKEMMEEIGVTKSIHQMRLQKVISGAQSASDILNRYKQDK